MVGTVSGDSESLPDRLQAPLLIVGQHRLPATSLILALPGETLSHLGINSDSSTTGHACKPFDIPSLCALLCDLSQHLCHGLIRTFRSTEAVKSLRSCVTDALNLIECKSVVTGYPLSTDSSLTQCSRSTSQRGSHRQARAIISLSQSTMRYGTWNNNRSETWAPVQLPCCLPT